MRFDLSEDQSEIKAAIREVLTDHASFERLRAASDQGSYDARLWQVARELGWAGIAVPEKHGGQGFGNVELALLLEEHGYHCAATPLLGTTLAALGLLHAGDPAQQAWLPRLSDGSITGTLGTTASGAGADLLPDGPRADIAVLVDESREIGRLVQRGDADFDQVSAVDTTRGYARVAPSGQADYLDGDVTAAVDRALVAVSAELVGLSQRALDLAVSYAKERQQFGSPIGAFQAVGHTAADMLFQVEIARSATYHAAWAADAGVPAAEVSIAASMAKAAASDAARLVTSKAIQLHGAFGFSWEADVHWLFSRAAVDSRFLGGAATHRTRVTELVAQSRRLHTAV